MEPYNPTLRLEPKLLALHPSPHIPAPFNRNSIATKKIIMDASPLFRQLLRMPAAHRNVLVQPTLRPHIRAFALSTQSLPQSPYQARSLSVPRILQPSFWASMIPKPLKTRTENTHKPKEWNPATPYIILGLLVGSQAIQILWLKQERNHEMRKAEAKIGVLREVIERVQRGEDVAVEEALGTGKKRDEREWKQGEFWGKLTFVATSIECGVLTLGNSFEGYPE